MTAAARGHNAICFRPSVIAGRYVNSTPHRLRQTPSTRRYCIDNRPSELRHGTRSPNVHEQLIAPVASFSSQQALSSHHISTLPLRRNPSHPLCIDPEQDSHHPESWLERERAVMVETNKGTQSSGLHVCRDTTMIRMLCDTELAMCEGAHQCPPVGCPDPQAHSCIVRLLHKGHVNDVASAVPFAVPALHERRDLSRLSRSLPHSQQHQPRWSACLLAVNSN